MIVEGKTQEDPPADPLATFQAGGRERKRKGKRQRPAAPATLCSEEVGLLEPCLHVCLYLIGQTHVSWQFLPVRGSGVCNWVRFCSGQNQGSLRKRTRRILGKHWSLPLFPCLLRPWNPSSAEDGGGPCGKHQGLSGHR